MVTLSYVDATEENTNRTVSYTDGQEINLHQQKYIKLFKELHDTHHFSHKELNALFKGVKIDDRVLELMDKQWEAKPYYQYRPLFITPAVIAKGKEKLQEYKPLLDRIERTLGVDREIVVAIWGVESRFGTRQGRYPVFTTLNTLFDAYPRRSSFFRNQLIQFLILCKKNHIDPLEIKGSYAGAFGQTQFIPSSFREYAINFDGDDRIDVFTSVDDILASIANYLHRYHWTLHAPIYRDIGNQLKSDTLVKVKNHLRKGYVEWAVVCKAQGITLPPLRSAPNYPLSDLRSVLIKVVVTGTLPVTRISRLLPSGTTQTATPWWCPNWLSS